MRRIPLFLSAIVFSASTFALLIAGPSSAATVSIAPKVLQQGKIFYIQPPTQIKASIYSYTLWDSRGNRLFASGKIRSGVIAKLTLKSSTAVKEVRATQYSSSSQKVIKESRFQYRSLAKVVLIAPDGSSSNTASPSASPSQTISSTPRPTASATKSPMASSSSPTAGSGGGGQPSSPSPKPSSTRSPSPAPTIKAAPTPSPTQQVNVPTAQPVPASSISPIATPTPPPTLITAPPSFTPAPVPTNPGIPLGATAQCLNGWFVFSSIPEIACRPYGGVQIYY
jgi:hypothetical protein